jgi:hypothetical protein
MRPSTILATAIVAVALVGAPRPASAEFGIGVFVGDPLGLTLKADLQRRMALEILLGESTYRDGRSPYGHVTVLVTPFMARGRSVLVPFRLGLGAAIYDEGGDFGDDVNFAIRAPFQLAFRFRAPVELYFELSMRLTFLDANRNEDLVDLDGGLGFRFYF